MNLNWNRIPFMELYPFERSPSYKWKAVLLFGLFVFIFLWIFQPFGLHNPIPNKIWILLGYGVITSFGVWLGMFVLPLLFKSFFIEESWYLWKEILYSMLIVVIIATLNLIYSASLGFFPFTVYNLIISLMMTLALGVFPVSAIIFISYNNHLKRHTKEADHISRNLGRVNKAEQESITIFDAENRPVIELATENLLCIESAQNYVEIHYLNKDLVPDKLLVRNTMKEITKQFHAIPKILRVHRSHIVNLSHIEEVKGNAQGLQLSLRHLRQKVPVSRTYLRPFERQFDSK